MGIEKEQTSLLFPTSCSLKPAVILLCYAIQTTLTSCKTTTISIISHNRSLNNLETSDNMYLFIIALQELEIQNDSLCCLQPYILN